MNSKEEIEDSWWIEAEDCLITLAKSVAFPDPSTENFEQLEILKSKYDAHFDYLSKGAIIRSRLSVLVREG